MWLLQLLQILLYILDLKLWISDFGATNHMNRDPSLVKDLHKFTQSAVSVADGNPAKAIREGSITVTNTITLDSVLAVPVLNYNIFMCSKNF